jgi:uncharacterized membrane protein YhdT
MNDTPRVDTPTVRLHKRQFAWQILVPFLVMTALVIAAAAFVVSGGVSGTRAWTDVSIIWILAPLLIFALLFVVVLGFLIYGIAKLTQVTPLYTGKAQHFFAMLSAGTRKIADGAAKPIVWIQQAGAVIKSIFKS